MVFITIERNDKKHAQKWKKDLVFISSLGGKKTVKWMKDYQENTSGWVSI